MPDFKLTPSSSNYDYSYSKAKFYWKFEYCCLVRHRAWVLRIKDEVNPQTACFPEMPEDTLPLELGKKSAEIYDVKYEQVYYWRVGLKQKEKKGLLWGKKVEHELEQGYESIFQGGTPPDDETKKIIEELLKKR